MSEYDIFIRNEVYPDANSIFKASIEPVKEIKNDCIYVLDTNTLLLPYYGSSKNLASIKSILIYLIKQNRLFIPGQAAREFAANRPDRIKEIFQTLNQQLNVLREFKNFKYPILNDIPVYQELTEMEKEYNNHIGTLRESYRKKLNEVLTQIKDWTWNDPVSNIYNELFSSDVVVDLDIDRAKLKKELEWRFTHKIPPGYKDQSKIDDGIGDLLIWKTILHLGTTHNKHLIFVSGEEKADWVYKSEGQILYPRYELVSEYNRTSQGQSFHIMKFSEFLEIMSGTEDLINEIERIELEIHTIDNINEFQAAYAFEFNEKTGLDMDRISTRYMINEELQLIKRIIELYIKMNESDTFKLQERFIDSITMVHRNGFFNYEAYKRLIHMYTNDRWDTLAEEELEKYYAELQQLRKLITTKLEFIRPLGL
jgi:hypothetical protein